MDKLLRTYSERAAQSTGTSSISTKKRSFDSLTSNATKARDDMSSSNATPTSSSGISTNKEYLDRNIVSIIFQGNEGFPNSVTHYYHFLFAAMYPLLEFHLSSSSTSRGYNGYRILTDVGPMKRILCELPLNIVDMAGPLTSLSRSDESRSHGIYALPAYDSFIDGMFGDSLTPTLSLSTIRLVNAYLGDNIPIYLSLIPTSDIVLIERSRESYYQSVETEQRNQVSGVSLRSIKNHSSLVEAMQSRFGSRFTSVVLERSSIFYQYQLFSNAKIIIGQHGAALSNIVFMVPPSSPSVRKQISKISGHAVIEILPPADFVKHAHFKDGARSHFRNLASHLGISYCPVHQEHDYSDVNVEEIVRKTYECLGEIDGSVLLAL